MTNELMTWK